MKILKSLTISLIAAIMTVAFTYGGYTIYAQTDITDYLTFQNPTGTFASVQSDYHHSMNQYFNDKVEILTDMLEKPSFQEDPNFNPPKSEEDCTKENVSSFCVSMGALDLYIEYVKTLNLMKGYLPTGELPPNATAQDLLNLDVARNADIEIEVVEAKAVIEGAVALYDEFRLAYPMHKKYEEIIDNLLKYKISLGKITKEVAKFPLKFVDTSSSECK